MANVLGGIYNIEWLNANSQRKYPFDDSCSLMDVSGTIQVPNDLIVDFLLPVHVDSTIDPSKFHLLRIATFGLGVSITFGYDGTPIGSISIEISSFSRNQVFYFAGTGTFYDSVGKVTIGSLDNIRRFSGAYDFSLINARLIPRVIIPDIRGVSAISIQNGNDVSDPVTGDVILQAGRNFSIAYVAGDGSPSNPNRFLLNAIEGAGLNTDCTCGEANNGPCIKKINGIAPNSDGEFFLEGSDCVLLDEIANGIQVVDECAKPCCGCSELDVVKTTLQTMVDQVNSLTSLGERLETSVSLLEFNLLSANPWGYRAGG